jgi:hypothetical protein
VNGAGYNLPRALGPALRGLVLARAGASANFFLNSLTFFVVLVVLYRWREAPRRSVLQQLPSQVRHCVLGSLRARRHNRNCVGTEARLGAIQEGAWAGLLLIEGDPAKGIQVIKDY